MSKKVIRDSQFFVVYLLSFFEIKRDQPDFVICYVTFDSLQNGKKILKKKVYLRGDMKLTISVFLVTYNRISMMSNSFT